MCARAESGMAIKAAVASLTQAVAETCRPRENAKLPPSRLREGSGVGTARQRSNCSNRTNP